MYDSNISSEYPFDSKFVTVNGSKIHYIDEGQGDVILFLHGMPSWSYLWRNVIPHLSKNARCIALDLVGCGRSEQPDIEYSIADHIQYVNGFIEKLNLKNIVFVAHSWGSTFALNYAKSHEDNVKAMAFMEPLFSPFATWDEFNPGRPQVVETFKKFRTKDVGWDLIVNQDVFVSRIGDGGNLRSFTEVERKFYREPFESPRSRLPIWRAPQELPIAGEPVNVVNLIEEYNRWLRRTHLPILLFHVDQGAFISKDKLNWCKDNLKNLTTYDLGKGAYWYIEDYPHTISKELLNWYKKLI
ncbi:Haloalkane dehalogenase [Aquicella siphonis]|uniref:Haloalkane dehalogenase n=1 Tax=Aquicella siphonis TaxID=254247 RepID=A0A5E4PLM9_9COXI|nr:haloalkane dehalogenase [Aquicella siphonis]VVC77162.1 Haloalkane dehalogenase [Aquicella siphonis]